MPPETATYLSPGGGCRLTIVPRHPDYFDGKARNVGTPQANATLECRRDGQWRRVWTAALVNEVAPVEALISDRMDYVVTFDNWYSVGYGDDAVAIYDVAGGAVRTFSVEKLLGADYFAALPRSVSSIHWRGDKRIEGGQLVIDIVVPDESQSFDTRHYVALTIDLASGRVSERSPLAWKAARASAEHINAVARASEQAWRAQHITPLLGPESNDEAGWHAYLREAFSRFDPDWVEGYPATDVLRASSAPNYRDSVRWVTEGLAEGGDVRMFAGADESDLIAVIEKGLASLPQGALREVRVYVAASETARPRLTALFAPSGARLAVLDPAMPIPQRRELLPRADGSLPSGFDFRKTEDTP